MSLASPFEMTRHVAPDAIGANAARALLATHLLDAWARGMEIDPRAFWPLRNGGATPGSVDHCFDDLAHALAASRSEEPAARIQVFERATSLATELMRGREFATSSALLSVLLAHARSAGNEGKAVLLALRKSSELTRRLHDASAAMRLLTMMESLATDLRDHESRLHARRLLGQAILARGNLPAATELLDSALREAEAGGHEQTADHLAGSLGMAFAAAGRHREAIPLHLRTAMWSTDALVSSMHMMNTGVSLMILGHRAAARAALEVAEARARDALGKSRIHLNLMRLAADFTDRRGFERWRARLLEEPIEAPMYGPMYCMMGEAYHIFGEIDEARAAFARSIALSERQGAGQWIFTAERGLAALDAGPAPAVPVEPEVPAEIAPAIAQVMRLRAAMPDGPD